MHIVLIFLLNKRDQSRQNTKFCFQRGIGHLLLNCQQSVAVPAMVLAGDSKQDSIDPSNETHHNQKRNSCISRSISSPFLSENGDKSQENYDIQSSSEEKPRTDVIWV